MDRWLVEKPEIRATRIGWILLKKNGKRIELDKKN